ncbi:hypothetical protein ST201phi2-1p408 [Pseudomonas phage 201phi2-1]|uniref:Uncharacterized protein n=1 Tax=Pseudomonas phage 201phi2-1 TaxID=198110 RepID=B3FJR7_BP201|nr:hypothetical protein ST201phi2-1p408 [Pseudomonas phage 201phi2-1]ABY63232.1 hypothetical protein 201phi2-1p408 [Pseudomonas phage 201phi2-1]
MPFLFWLYRKANNFIEWAVLWVIQEYDLYIVKAKGVQNIPSRCGIELTPVLFTQWNTNDG